MTSIREVTDIGTPEDGDVQVRREQVRAVLAANDWNALIVVGQESAQHITGWDIEITRYWPDRPLVAVVSPDETVLVVWQEMIKMGKRPGPYVDRLVGYSHGGGEFRTAADAVTHVLRGFGAELGAVGLEKSRAHVNFYERLVEQMPNVRVDAADESLAMLRMVKTARELEVLTAAAQRADQAFWCAVKDAQPGTTELELAGRIRAAAAEYDCVVTMLTVASGERACAVNAPTHRAIQVRDIIRVDFNMRYGTFDVDDVTYGGYFADIGRMAVMGQPSEAQLRAYRDQVELKQRIIDFIRPGRTACDIYRHYRTVASEMGVELFLLPSIGVGHGIGVVNDEAPRLTEVDTTLIQENMALALEPDTVGPGNALMHVEDVVAVGADGAKLISWSRDWTELPVLGAA